MPEIEFFHLTDVGCVRADNEDAIGCWPHEDGLLFAVADGLGGHNAGEVASGLALEVLIEKMQSAPESWPIEKRLRRAVQEANLRIYNKSTTVPELRRMGTTLTATVLAGVRLVAAHIGDCRLYLARGGALAQLTKDHTWVGEQVRHGVLSPEEARAHPKRHVLSRSLGSALIVGIDVLTMDIRPGDVLAQVSDGIHELVPEARMLEALQAGQPDAACRALIRQARDAGGGDNLSVQVAAVVSCPPAPRRTPWWRFGR